jgi:RNA recognition motif-containing protein
MKSRNYDLCRKLFKNALKNVTEYAEQLNNDWVEFEKQFGTLQFYLDAIVNTKPASKVNLIGKQEVIQINNIKEESKKEFKQKKRELEEDKSNSISNEIPTKKAKIDSSSNLNSTELKKNTKSSTNQHPTTLFVTKFSKNLTDQGLHDLFSSFGTIVGAHVVKDKVTGESKCHGLVQFSTEKEKEAARSLHQSNIDGNIISVLPSKFPAVLDHHSEIIERKSDDYQDKKSMLAFKPRGVQSNLKQKINLK